MQRASQFSLSYLLMEVTWIAAAAACFGQVGYAPHGWQPVLLVYGTLFAGIALGGLFGRMPRSYWLGAAIIVAGFLASLLISQG
jgi:hypothetical protein